MRKLILASASPRRAELLRAPALTFDVRAADVDETPPWRPRPRPTTCIRVAREKAQSVASGIAGTGAIVLAADTTVVTDSEIMGKPRNGEDAASMLAALSGTVHEVLTGVVVRADTREQVELVTTRVHFLPLSPPTSPGTSARASRGQGGRLRDSGTCGAVHRLDRRLVVERRRAAARDGEPHARRRRVRRLTGGGTRGVF